MNIDNKIKEMEVYAIDYKIPIMQDDAIQYIKRKIDTLKLNNILELGTAIAYSTILFASTNELVRVTSIERDENRYNVATKNVKDINYENKIKLIFDDALNVNLTDKYDLIIIDASKGKNINFFEHFKSNLSNSGLIIFDNMNFHGLVGHSDEIKSKNLRKLVSKIEEFKEFIKAQEDYYTEFIEVGDGLAVCVKK